MTASQLDLESLYILKVKSGVFPCVLILLHVKKNQKLSEGKDTL